MVLTSFLSHKGSHESKDSDEEMRAQLTRIKKKLELLEAQQSRAGQWAAKRARG